MSGAALKLVQKYKKEVIPEMKKIFHLKNDLAVPKIVKVVVNTGLGRIMMAASQGKVRDELLNDLKKDFSLITGQWPKEGKAKKSISAFKTREGMTIGLSTTLRGKRMNDFLERLIKIVLPRVRDFRGIDQQAFDEKGNLNIGIKEMVVFSEVPAQSSKHLFGLEITAVTSAKTKEQAVELFKLSGFPIKKGQ